MKAIYAVPATLALCHRAYSHNSLTPLGIFAAALTAVAHAIHPWNLPFVLLVVFYQAGSWATKVKKDVKATLTLNSTGASGGEGPRTHVQVLANSITASILTLLHAYQLHLRSQSTLSKNPAECYTYPGDLLVVGIIANYAAVAADTLSSELGILSRSSPRLITSWNLRKVPRGTNGGVTAWGLLAGLGGSALIVGTSLALLPFCSGPETFVDVLTGNKGAAWALKQKLGFAAATTVIGGLGSVLDSFLGGWLQESVVDTRTNKIVEGDGGKHVLVSKRDMAPINANQKNVAEAQERGSNKGVAKGQNAPAAPSRTLESGLGLLDNNEVNFLMAFTMSIVAMAGAAWVWDVPLASALPWL